MDSFKQRVLAGHTVFGTFICLGDALTTELLASVGLDWVLIDLEHGAGGERQALSQMQALGSTRAQAVVRVESVCPQRIYRMLDSGARGIMCPRINSARQAQAAVDAMRYPPEGKRGTAKLVRATGFGETFDRYRGQAANELVCMIQIETPAALEEVEAIASVQGVDVLFIGPSDLSMELGIFEQWEHPLFVQAVERTVAAARRGGKACGILLFEPAELARYYSMGIRVFACGSDGSLLRKAGMEMLDSLRLSLEKLESGS